MAQNVDEALPASKRLKKNAKSKAMRQETRGRALIYTVASIVILATFSITLFLTIQGLQTFIVDHVNPWKFISGTKWSQSNSQYGALPFIAGSFTVTLLATVIAGPIGIGGAIFMVEIAKRWGQKVLQPIIEILVGIPSVVYGYIGLVVLAPFIHDHIGGVGYSVLAAFLVLSVMVLPTVTSIATDALKSVPQSMRDASYALGSTRWQTIYKVVIPAALPQLLTAVVLGAARAFGEALAVEMVIGGSTNLPTSLLNSASTLTTIITDQMGDATTGSLPYHALWSLALILLLMSYVFIIIIRFLSSRRKL